MVVSKTSQLWPNVLLNRNSQQIFGCWFFYDVHLIMVDSTQLGNLESEICFIEKFRADILFSVMILLQTRNKLVFPTLHQVQKA